MTAEPLPPPDLSGTPARPSPPRRLRPSDEIAHEDALHRDMSRYPGWISQGVYAAQFRLSGVVDSVTARRMSLLLLSQSQDPQLSSGLAAFASDGSVTGELRRSLHRYARQSAHPHHQQSWTLLQYVKARGTNLGPLGADFAATCDQADQDEATPISGEQRDEWAYDLFEDVWERHHWERDHQIE